MSSNFWRITLDTNPDHCNLNCLMCEDHSTYSTSSMREKRPIMPKALLESVLEQASFLGFKEVIPSTMGEPLLYPYFDSFISICRKYNFNINLTTNGTFPGKGAKYWAEQIVPIGSDVKISWNGATEKTHATIMHGATLKNHISNARKFITIRNEKKSVNYCSLTMQLTFMELNLHEVVDMVRLAIALGFDRVKGHHIWTHFKELNEQSLRRNRTAIESWNSVVRQCHEIIDKHNRNENESFRLDNFYELDPGQIDDIAPGGQCPFLGREVWVSSSGRFNICCAPDQERTQLGYFGNLCQDRLIDVLQGQAYEEFYNTYMNELLCQKCNMRRPVGDV